MQNTQFRYLILTVLLAAGALVMAGFDRPREAGVSRWPIEDATYAVAGWAMGALSVDTVHGVTIITRTYRHPDGRTATLAISTSPEAKRIYRVGAEVPFLGSGYTVDPAPPSLVTPTDGRGALLVRREAEHGLLIFGYGERRGIVGNGGMGWSAVVVDAVLGRRNDYYLARVLSTLDPNGAASVSETVGLADTLLQRLAAWYAT
jgi:hypothetical protein